MSTPLPLKEIHHVELLVGNAKQAAFYYRHAFGFSQIAYAGPRAGRLLEEERDALGLGSVPQLPCPVPVHWAIARANFAADDEPVEACPPSLGYKARKFARKLVS